MNPMNLTPISEQALRQAANIIGPQSAAAKALEDAGRRRAVGQTVEFFTERTAGPSIYVYGSDAATHHA